MENEYFIGDFLKRIKRSIELEDNRDYKLVTIRINHNGIKLRGTKKGHEIKSKMYEVKKGDFILSGIDARHGAFGIIPDELDGAIVTNDFWYFEIDDSIINKHLFLELTATNWFDDICKRGSDGTTQRIRLKKNKFFNQKILLPKPENQNELYLKIKNFKEKSEKIKEEITNQKPLIPQLKQAILQEAIEGKLTADWRKQNPDVEPAEKLLKRIKVEKQKLIAEKKLKKAKPLPPITKEEIPFELPKGWVWCRLEQVSINIHYGLSVSANFEKEDVRLLRITDIQNNNVNWDCVPGCNYSKKDLDKYLLSENDILIARTGGTIGKSYLVKKSSVKSLFASYLIRVVPSKLISANYVKFFIESPIYWKQLYEAAWGAGQPNVNGTKLKNLIVAFPPINEQNTIAKKIETLMQKINPLKTQIKQSEINAQMLMQAILKEAFDNR